MRELKFRGVPAVADQFVYGGYVYDNEDSEHLIVEMDILGLKALHLVKPETVGQFTGLKDKNGIDIYEGDIVLSRNWYNGAIGDFEDKFYPLSEDQENITEEGGAVEWVNLTSSFCVKSAGPNHHPYLPMDATDEWEVIGNIHQHPELLTSKEGNK